MPVCEVYARRAGCVRGSTPGGGGQTRAGRMPSAVAFPAADGRQDRSDDENAKRRGGRKAKCRASYSHTPAERGCKRMSEGNGRIPLRRTAGRSSLRGEALRTGGRSQRIQSETEQADKSRKPETESTEAPLRHVGRSRRGCCCRGERNRRARSEEKALRRRSRNGGKRSAEETGSRRRTEAGDRPE